MQRYSRAVNWERFERHRYFAVITGGSGHWNDIHCRWSRVHRFLRWLPEHWNAASVYVVFVTDASINIYRLMICGDVYLKKVIAELWVHCCVNLANVPFLNRKRTRPCKLYRTVAVQGGSSQNCLFLKWFFFNFSMKAVARRIACFLVQIHYQSSFKEIHLDNFLFEERSLLNIRPSIQVLRNTLEGGRVSDFPKKVFRRCTVQR